MQHTFRWHRARYPSWSCASWVNSLPRYVVVTDHHDSLGGDHEGALSPGQPSRRSRSRPVVEVAHCRFQRGEL